MEPRWLNIKNAICYSGMGRDRLKKLAVAGEIKGFQDIEDHDKWIFDRLSLDQYRENQAGNIELKAIALMGGK